MLILMVDDDYDDFEIFCEALKAVNAKVRCLHATNGAEAFDLLKNHMVDLPDYIFLDINMPVMNGRECLTRIKKDNRLKEIPVVIYSTSSDVREMEYCKGVGAREFIVKPGSFEKLVSVISSTIT